MEKREIENEENKGYQENEKAPPYDLLYITQLYNEGLITFKDWLRQSEEWANQVIHRRYSSEETP